MKIKNFWRVGLLMEEGILKWKFNNLTFNFILSWQKCFKICFKEKNLSFNYIDLSCLNNWKYFIEWK